MAVISKDLGAVTAYAAAVNRGYTGTKEEFETLMASYATVAQQAAESAQSASQSAQSASGSATDAQTANGTAQQAATDAQTAQASAQESAQSAQQSAQSASQSAQSAESAKETAVDAVDGFAAGAQQALDSVNQAGNNWKSLAQAQKLDAEAWATGKRDGEDVGSSDPAYHNNAKYYAESAGTSAQTASESAQTATQKASEAQASASAADESARTIIDAKADLDTVKEIVGAPITISKKNVAIYLTAGSNFKASVANPNRVSTDPIFVPDGATYKITASGFGKYAYISSNDGVTTIYGNVFKQGTSYERSFTGPLYLRFTFANANDTTPISSDSVTIAVDTGTKNLNERVTEIENSLCLDSFGHYIHVPQNIAGNNVVATYKKMYVRNNNGILQLSADSGETWNDGFDVSEVGLIKTYHLFDNGCIAFFTHQKAYYSEDWETFTEASVYESDGSAYTPSTYDNFTISRDHQERLFVGTQDLFVFGNYGITDEANTRRIIWYSIDNGHSYRVAFEFNITGKPQIRHIHNVIYNPNNGHFLCCTGDTDSQSLVMQMDYDASQDEWTFGILGNNSAYKWASVALYGAYVYFCYDNTPGSVKRCKYKDINDPSKWETVLDNLPNDCIGLFIGERGDMLVSLSKYRSGNTNSPFAVTVDARRLYYSPDREHFYSFMGDNPGGYAHSIYYGFMGVNGDGKVVSGFWEGPTALENWGKLPCIYLDQMVKNYGFPNAFKPYDTTWEIIPVVDVECEDVSLTVGSSVTITPKLYPYNASSLSFEIVGYDSSIVSVNNSVITGNAIGSTTAKIRSKTNYEAYKEITITVI